MNKKEKMNQFAGDVFLGLGIALLAAAAVSFQISDWRYWWYLGVGMILSVLGGWFRVFKK